MNNTDEIKNTIWRLMNALRGVLFSREIEYSVVRLIFIKYAVDNCIGASTVEDMQLCARAQKMFAMRDVDNGLDSIVPILRYIDKAYRLDGILSGTETINMYSDELFGREISLRRKSTTVDNYRYIMEILSSLDLEESDETINLGQIIVKLLAHEIEENSSRYGFASEHTTRHDLSKLVAEILRVDTNDCFCDFASGFGLSTLEIVKDINTPIKNADMDPSTISIATMLLIMSGYKNIDMRSYNTLSIEAENFSGNKVFVDAPFGRPHSKSNEYKYNDYALDTIDRIINSYMNQSEDAVSVVTAHSSFLFRSNRQTRDFRADIINKGYVKAVVALGALKNRTASNVNIIVLTRKPNKDVVFVNTIDEEQKAANRNDSLSNELIDKIVSAIESTEEIAYFSKIVSIKDISQKDYNLLPTVYVDFKTKEDNTTLEEVNSQLNDLYKQLLGQ